MKKHLLFIFLLVQTFTVFGYDYQTVYSHRIVYFDNEFGRTEAIKMDSVRLQQNDSVIYPFRGLQLIADNCFTPEGNTWMGEKIIVTSAYNYFFNELNDTIMIKTIATLNETWQIYTKNDVRITGTVTKWELSDVLGQQDSVKTITLHVYDARMSPLPHPLEGKTIKISKKYGIVASVSLLYFPSSQYTNYSNIRIPQEFTLLGMTNPILGVQNFTWFEANDFQIGDEFHYQELEFSLEDHRKSGRSIKKIVERTNYLPDSIIYTYNIRSVDTVTTYHPIYETKIIYNNQIKHEIISSYKIFDLLPGQIVYTNTNLVAKSIMFGSEKSLYPEEIPGSENCWNYGVEIDGSCEQSYAKGLGLFYKSCSTVFWFSNYEKKLVYYKKGNEEWGVPLILSGLNNVKQINFSISPNPAKDVLKITLNESIYEPTTAKIINSLGKTVLVQKLENQEQSVSLKNIPAGIYLLQIEKGNQKESVKFIKQ